MFDLAQLNVFTLGVVWAFSTWESKKAGGGRISVSSTRSGSGSDWGA